MTKKLLRTAACLLAAALSVVGCGDEDDDLVQPQAAEQRLALTILERSVAGPETAGADRAHDTREFV
ncbi:MAG: hypothetical protein OXH38_11105 [Chloroflexi bacterium]|nr:hypothetical protein [Chloroflexota bacterium]